MKITFYGHSALHIETAGKNLVVDPFISGNEKAKKIDLNSLKADYVLLTHAHQDHILDAETIARKHQAKIVSNYEIVTHYGKKGIDGHPMNHGGKWEFDFGRLHYVNAIHSSSFPDGSYGGQPGGFILQSEDKTVYIAGDTALTSDMKIWGENFDFDLVILPIGDNFTMGYEDASVAAQWLRCKQVLGVHFDTFGFIEIDHQAAQKCFKNKRIHLHLLGIGEHLTI